MSVSEGIKQFEKAVGWDPDLIDESTGDFSRGGNCCAGSRLAMELGIKEGDKIAERLGFYLAGADTWAQKMGGCRAHAILMLRECGAGHDPFGAEPWLTPPEEVAERLALHYEALPDLTYADLSNVDLSWADLRGQDLRFANFYKANLDDADLSDAKLGGVIMAHAVADEALLVNVSMRDARLEWASLTYADLRGADLRYANVWQTDFHGADFSDANLAGANFNQVKSMEGTRGVSSV